MAPELLLTRALFAAALVLLLIGAVAGWAAPNAIKRLAGVALAMLGAILGLAALGAPNALLIAAAAVAFAQLALGAAVVVRLQEDYGAIEAPETDQADRQDDLPERAP